MVVKLLLKPSIYIMQEKNEYHVIFTATRKIKTFEIDSLVKDCISVLKNRPSMEQILNNLEPNYSKKDITDCIEALKYEGIAIESMPEIETRYEKQISFISELTSSTMETLEIQNKIRNSKIAIFGVGGVGTWMVNGLYQLGVGEIRISEPDTISESNLNRQLYFNSNDIGKYKVDVIAEKLPDAKIIKFKKTVDEMTDLSEIIEQTNMIINCADNPSVVDTSRIIDKYARRFNIPYMVTGGYNMHLGMVGTTIIPGKSACFECLIEHQKQNDPFSKMTLIKDIEQTGNLGPVAGAVANIQLMDVFKYLSGKGEPNINKFFEIDFLNFNVEWRYFNKIPGCKTCGGL